MSTPESRVPGTVTTMSRQVRLAAPGVLGTRKYALRRVRQPTQSVELSLGSRRGPGYLPDTRKTPVFESDMSSSQGLT